MQSVAKLNAIRCVFSLLFFYQINLQTNNNTNLYLCQQYNLHFVYFYLFRIGEHYYDTVRKDKIIS